MASHSSDSPSRWPHKQLPLPVENTTRVFRRFASEPIEVSSRSSRGLAKKDRQAVTDGTDVAVVSAETAIIDSGKNAGDFQTHPQAQIPKVVTGPKLLRSQPVETGATSVKPRKFAPQLIESTRRSRKSGDLGPTLSAQDRTDVSPGAQEQSFPSHILFQPSQFPIPPDDGSLADQIPQAPESRFSSSTLRKREPRRHSFRVPNLPSIQSSGDSEGSNDSNCPSLSTSPSAASDETQSSKYANKSQTSGHEKRSNHLLSSAAQATQKQLREQAMAAYPNEQMHEPVDHFSVDREDDEDDEDEDEDEDSTDPDTMSNDTPRASQTESQIDRRDSAADWSMAEMRQHHELLEKQGKRQQITIQPKMGLQSEVNGVMYKPTDSAQYRQQEGVADTNYHSSRKRDGEMEKMRKAASPPMAGEDLRFPMCQSPRQTRLDVSQYPLGRRLPGTDAKKRHSGLWAQAEDTSRQPFTAGLWMGTSVKPTETASLHPAPVRAGLLTPDAERDDLSTPHVSLEKDQLPSSPLVPKPTPKSPAWTPSLPTRSKHRLSSTTASSPKYTTIFPLDIPPSLSNSTSS